MGSSRLDTTASTVVEPSTAVATPELPAVDHGELLSELCERPERTLVLTATRRLARHLKMRLARHQAEAGHGAWLTPRIVPLDAWWLQEWWNLPPQLRQTGDGAAVEAVLSELEARHLWEAVIERHLESALGLHADTMVSAAMEAWGRVHEWRIALPFAEPLSVDAEAFGQWAAAYQDELQRRGWIDSEGVPERVIAGLASGGLKAPGRAVLAGFDELTPRTSALLAALAAGGAELARLGEPAAQTEPVVRSYPDAAAEAQAVARWARGRLKEHGGASLHIIAPDVAAVREPLSRELTYALTPSRVLPAEPVSETAFDISLGQPLAAAPVAQAALLVVKLVSDELQGAEAGALLRSPFLAGFTAERAARAALDAELRKRGYTGVDIRTLLQVCRRPPTACPELLSGLAALPAGGDIPGRARVSDFLQVMRSCLEAVGWPNSEQLDGAAAAAARKFGEVLDELSRLDRIMAAMTFRDAAALVRGALYDTVFQEEGQHVPVKVMGVLESAGLTADHVWVMGLHDDAWPPKPNPNPFLPASLQRTLGLPRASAEREAEYAARVMSRILKSSRNVVLSYPCREGDRELAPSPLLPSAATGVGSGRAPPLVWQLIGQDAPLEELCDWRGPRPAGSSLAGGAGLFSSQAACPFKGFARHSLRAEPLEEPRPGLSPLERGELVHNALEFAWQKLKSHRHLKQAGAEERTEIAAGAARRAVARFVAKRGPRLPERLRPLEVGRLTRLLTDWFAVEEAREPFIVASLESRRHVEVGGVAVRIRVDRVDRLENGRLVILDYKTGRSVLLPWTSPDRPEDAQLPLYLAAVTGEIAGVALARVNPEEMKLQGVSDGPQVGGGVTDAAVLSGTQSPESWQELTDTWRAGLERLAGEILSGVAHPDPKRQEATCNTCGLFALCRIRELQGAPDARHQRRSPLRGGTE